VQNEARRDFLNIFRKPLIQMRQNEERQTLVVRPPYAGSESLFQKVCVTCDSKTCVASCDEKIIFIAEDGTPALNFTSSGCTFCEDCVEACEPNVLDLAHSHNTQKLNATFSISTQGCVAHNGVICFSCKEPCIDDAILFNGMFNPVIDMDKCTGCGFCMGRCPTQAIDFTPIALKEQAHV